MAIDRDIHWVRNNEFKACSSKDCVVTFFDTDPYSEPAEHVDGRHNYHAASPKTTIQPPSYYSFCTFSELLVPPLYMANQSA